MHFQPVDNLLTTCWSTGWKWLEGRHQQVDFFGQPVVNRLTTGWTKNSNLLKEPLNRLTTIVENRIPTASNRLKFFPTCCQQVDNRLIFFFNWLELLGQPVEEHLSTCWPSSTGWKLGVRWLRLDYMQWWDVNFSSFVAQTLTAMHTAII